MLRATGRSRAQLGGQGAPPTLLAGAGRAASRLAWLSPSDPKLADGHPGPGGTEGLGHVLRVMM